VSCYRRESSECPCKPEVQWNADDENSRSAFADVSLVPAISPLFVIPDVCVSIITLSSLSVCVCLSDCPSVCLSVCFEVFKAFGRPGHCLEIPGIHEILKVILKCHEVYSMSWIFFCSCPRIKKKENNTLLYWYMRGLISASGSGRPCPRDPQTNCGSRKLKGILAV